MFFTTLITTFKKLPLPVKIGGVVAIGLVVWFAASKLTGSKAQTTAYQTTQVEKGTLVTTVSASGNITSGNSLTMITNATGTVKNLYVKNGDTVKQGQKIAEITPDQDSLQKQASAWSSYLSAKNSLASAQTNLYSLQSKEFAANQVFMNGAVKNEDSTSDPTYIQQNADWLAAEASYKNQAGVVQQAQSNLNSAWLNYQQYSSTITAPRAGTIANLTIAPGSVISVQSSSSNSSSNPQKLGTIVQENDPPQASVDIAEIDAPKVQPGQKVTLTLDAFPDKTFTGKILIVDTNGSVSSGVTVYPAVIVFDVPDTSIYPNMAVTAQIITNVDSDVLLVPSAAVTTSNGTSSVRVLENKQAVTKTVELGDANDTQVVITSGLSEGEAVITGGGTTTSTTKSSGATTSPFSMFGGRGGGNVRVGR